jgi:hypothetical protein
MPRARTFPATPLWVRAIVLALAVGVPGWLALEHHDRVVNQNRLSVIASEIAGRPVRVHCPGVLGRALSWDTVDGSVRFDAAGRPSDRADVRARPCAELDALAEGRRQDVLACVALGGGCGAAGDDLATAVDVLTHESVHLSGVMDEAVTECRSLQLMARTAERLGATPSQAHALAAHQLDANYGRLPDRYQSAECRDGGALDLRPGDPVWP